MAKVQDSAEVREGALLGGVCLTAHPRPGAPFVLPPEARPLQLTARRALAIGQGRGSPAGRGL